MTDDLLERLRVLEAAATKGPWRKGGAGIFPSIMDAAGFAISATGMSKRDLSECRANAALIVAMRNALPDLLARIEARDREIEGLREALEPFAELAGWYDDYEDDSFPVWSDYPHGYRDKRLAELRHFRRARAALTRDTPVKEDGDG